MVSSTLSPRGDLDLFTFTLTETTRVVLLASTTAVIQPALRLLAAAGNPPVTGTTVTWSYTTARLDLTLPPGIYFVEVSDAYDDQSGAYMFVYEPQPISTTQNGGA